MDADALCVCIDAGEREWRYGWADDEGSQGIEVAPGLCVAEAAESELHERLTSAFNVLEATPSDHPCLVSERPGATAQERETLASALWTALGVPHLCVVAAPLLALYNAGKDTCTLVDVGERATFVLPVYCGHAVLEAATVLPLGGGSLPNSGPDAICDALLEPAETGAEAGAVGVPEAVLRTVQLCDVSVRGALLDTIVLVGGGTRLDGFPDRLLANLRDRLRDVNAPFEPKVVANADRRIAAWMGGSLLCGVPSAQRMFISREAYEANPAVLHASAVSLACRDIAAQEEASARQRRDETAQLLASRRAAADEAQRAAAEAREWWVAQAPAGGAVERDRQRRVQTVIVAGMLERAVMRDIFGCLPLAAHSARKGFDDDGDSGGGGGDGGDGGDDGGGGGVVGGTGRAGKRGANPNHIEEDGGGDDENAGPHEDGASSRRSVAHAPRAEAALAQAARALRLLSGEDEEVTPAHRPWGTKRAVRSSGRSGGGSGGSSGGSGGGGGSGSSREVRILARLRHQLYVRWTTSDMNCDGAEVERSTRAHARTRRQRRGWLLWQAMVARRADLRGAVAEGALAWQHQLAWAGGLRRWRASMVSKLAHLRALHGARRFHFHGLLLAWGAWVRERGLHALALSRASAAGQPRAMRRLLGGWQTGADLQRAASRRRAVVYIVRVGAALRAWRRVLEARKQNAIDTVTAQLVAWDATRAAFWDRLHAYIADAQLREQLAVVGELARRRLAWRRLRAGAEEDAYLARRMESGCAPVVSHRRRLRALDRALERWSDRATQALAVSQMCEVVLARRIGFALTRWHANAHLARVVWRVKMRRTAARLRRGLGSEQTRKLRRALHAFARRREEAAAMRKADDTGASIARRREARRLRSHFKYWCAEAAWRKQRQKWMKRQVRYMHELQSVLDQAGDGQRLARRLLSLGVQPQRESAWSDETLRAGRVAIKRSNAALERALRRESRGGDEATLDRLRVLAPGVDSYLADVLDERV